MKCLHQKSNSTSIMITSCVCFIKKQKQNSSLVSTKDTKKHSLISTASLSFKQIT